MHRKLSPSIGTARSPTGANPRCPHPHLGDREGQRRRCESGRIRARSRIVKTVQVGTTPLNLALAPGGGRVYTSDFSSNTVSVVDTASYAVVATVSVGRSPTDVAVNPDGRHAYAVASEINMNPHGNVSVIDTATNTVTATIEVGGNPTAIAVTPDGKHAYVANSGDNTMSVLDLTTNTVAVTLPAGARPVEVALTPDGRRAYVSNYDANTVTVLDTATNETTATLRVGTHPHGIGISPDGTRGYFTIQDKYNGLLVPFDPATGALGTPVQSNRYAARVAFVDVPAPATPVADFTVAPTAGSQPPNTFTFDPSASQPGLSRIVSSSLDTGDGIVSTMPKPVAIAHTYRTPGTYTATLTIVDAEGRVATARKQVLAQSLTRTFSLLALSNLRYVTAEDAGRKPLIPRGTAAGEWETIQVRDLGGGDVSLFAPVNNRYLTVDPATSKVVAGAVNADPFQYVAGADGTFSLKYKATGKYVSTNLDRELTADRTAIGPWELFAGTVATNVSWSATVKGYVCAEDAGRKALIANRTQVGSWETFDLIDAGDGEIAFFAHANYRFVTAEAAGAQPLIANRTAIGAWEKFKIVNGTYGYTQALLANANGRYVTAEAAGAQPLIANRTAAGPWENFTGLR